ncbi:hypothetical protein AN958_06506 [Leucoagaricus sp. SymC.cos]|nr:hypothetical protein AN958_06506 [Leucoagaricus sp. SymC.cos]
MVPVHSILLPISAVLFATGSVCARGTNWIRRSPEEPPLRRDPSIPHGSKVYGSGSTDIHYEGKWATAQSKHYLSGSLRSTQERGASFSLSFTGSGIEWLGDCDRFHGSAQVYLDGEEAEKINLFCDSATPRNQQRHFYRSDLKNGQHTIKVVNLGFQAPHTQRLTTTVMDVDALVVTPMQVSNSKRARNTFSPFVRNTTRERRAPPLRSGGGDPERPRWELSQHGMTGVAAMQLSIISATHAIIIDKVEHNPLSINGHGAWAALYNLNTDELKPLEMKTNSFCAGGAFLSNGTLVNTGGAPVDKPGFGDINGLQGIRLFHPCESENVDKCEMIEDPVRMRMASSRWYPTAVRIEDGSVLIIGGSVRGGYINSPDMNNPTIEYYPPKSIHGSNGLPIPMQFLKDTLNSNLFPIAFLLPDGKIFMAANNDAMIYDWKRNTEQRLPSLPNGVRVTYPMTGTALLLPLSPENDYTPEVLICGGSTLSDRKPPEQLSSQDPASAQCVRMVLTEKGIAQGWQMEEMPEARVMPDAVLLPTGQIVIVNGGKTVFTPVLYNPQAPRGKRFYRDEDMPTSSIPRLYHSIATLTPRGDLMITGSNPNFDRSEVKYVTEYRVEWLSPPYMRLDRPYIEESPRNINFKETFAIRLNGAAGEGQKVEVALMDLGFISHSVHMNSRHVWLVASRSDDDETVLTVTAPPREEIYPPGPGWLYVLIDGVPSEGRKVMVGERQPPVDKAAIDK